MDTPSNSTGQRKGGRPTVVCLLQIAEEHGARRAVVVKDGDYTYIELTGCTKWVSEWHNYARRAVPIASCAIVDESLYIAAQVAKRLEESW